MQQFNQGLEVLGCTFSQADFNSLWSRYAQDGKLDYEEYASKVALRGSPATANMQPSFNMEREPPTQILSEIKARILSRGIYGITDFVNLFNKYANNGSLGRPEAKWCLRENGQTLSEQETDRIFKYFDKNGDGKISIHEFIAGVRGALNKNRDTLVNTVWN